MPPSAKKPLAVKFRAAATVLCDSVVNDGALGALARRATLAELDVRPWHIHQHVVLLEGPTLRLPPRK